jgi:hypothetical protein
MKIANKALLLIFATALISFIACAEKVETVEQLLASDKPKIDRDAEAFSDGKAIDAVAYAMGSNGGYTLKNELNYKTPTMVGKLTHQASFNNERRGAKEAADEIPSITNYYDGAEKLNSIKVQCRIYTTANDCVHQSGCGWCGATSSCITGNQMGPTEPCAKSTYVFTSAGIYSPQERVIKENVGGLAVTITSK